MIKAPIYLLFFLSLVVTNVQAHKDLLGEIPSELQVDHWINSEPTSLQQLKGKVVLIRWWTAPDCPYCSASSAALNEWYQKYHDAGLEVIGLYHHKKSSPFSLDDVKFFVDKFGFKFPVAIDTKWRTLRDWWLKDNKREWTSASF